MSAKASNPDALLYVDKFTEGLRSDVDQDKAPPGSLVVANNVRWIPGGGFVNRLGQQTMTNWTPGTSAPIGNMKKMLALAPATPILFVQSGTKIFHTKGETLPLYDTGIALTAGTRCQFLEFNYAMKYSNGVDSYGSIIVATALSQFTNANTRISLGTGTASRLTNGGTVYCKGQAIPYTGVLSIGTNILYTMHYLLTFTADHTTGIFTSTGNSLTNGDTLKVSNSGGSLPSGMDNSTTYYVINATTNTFKLSLTLNGAAIAPGDDGSGTNSINLTSSLFVYTSMISAVTFTADSTTSKFTSVNAQVPNGTAVKVSTSNTLPSGLDNSTQYYVVSSSGYTFQLATSLNGVPVLITTNGAGTQTLSQSINPNGVQNGDIVYLINSAGAAPAGFQANTQKPYYVVQATSSNFRLAATLNGTGIQATDNGSGTNWYQPQFDCLVGCTVPSGTYEAGQVITQALTINAPKATVLGLLGSIAVLSGELKDPNISFYSLGATTSLPNNIDNFDGLNRTSYFGEFGAITAMKMNLGQLYVAKSHALQVWTGFDSGTPPAPVVNPFSDFYGVTNADCLVFMGGQANDRLLFLTDNRGWKTIELQTIGFYQRPTINGFFDQKIQQTMLTLDTSQTIARGGYCERDRLARFTVSQNSIPIVLVYDNLTDNFSIDTGIQANCWEEFNGFMYFGSAIDANIYKPESGYQDGGLSNPRMDALTPNHWLADRRTRVPVSHVYITGLIGLGTQGMINIYSEGALLRSFTLKGTDPYVSTTAVRSFGRQFIGKDYFGHGNGADNVKGLVFGLGIDISTDLRNIQMEFVCDWTGGRLQINSYEVVRSSRGGSQRTQSDIY